MVFNLFNFGLLCLYYGIMFKHKAWTIAIAIQSCEFCDGNFLEAIVRKVNQRSFSQLFKYWWFANKEAEQRIKPIDWFIYFLSPEEDLIGLGLEF